DAFQAEWLAYAPAWFTTDADPSGPPVVIQLDGDGQRAVTELGDGRVRTRVGNAAHADLTLPVQPGRCSASCSAWST
ncbi:MAG: hypothetical protein ACRDOI_36765, partial [Trebonia sp.]